MASTDFRVVRFGAFNILHDATKHGKGTICRECGTVKPGPWVNPILTAMKKLGRWKGTIYGGVVVCDGCDRDAALAQAATVEADRLAATGIPKEFRTSTWDEFDPRRGKLRESIEYFRQWVAEDDPPWLYLFGTVGTGKTKAACTLVRDWMRERKLPVQFMTVSRLVRRSRQAEFEKAASRGGISLGAVSRYSLFALDDVGAEKATDYGTGKLMEFLDARHELDGPTILTSNLDLEQLSEHLGNERVSSRLAQWCHFVKLDVSDYRVVEAKRKMAKR